jgi:ATP-dependent DNA helicase RecG
MYPVPEAALREAVLNAIIHRDYSSGTPIQISVYQDKLMLWNSGELPPDWTVARLKRKHSSRPFNPDIANAFFRAGMIEAWGRGIELILDACRAAQTPEPELLYEHTGLWVNFHFRAVSEAETRVKTRVETPQRILELLRSNPEMTLAEVAGVIGKSLSAVERASAKLVKDARLRHVGPRKGGHWEVLE